MRAYTAATFIEGGKIQKGQNKCKRRKREKLR
jgi:hypothetical protein